MSFLSVPFICFVIVVLLLLHFIKDSNKQQWLLLLANCIFYGFSNWRFLFLLAFVILVVYKAALSVHKNKAALYLGIILPLGALGIFKYLNFFRSSLDWLLNLGPHENLILDLPLGISFYTFLAISYLLDVYHKKLPPDSSFMSVALYVSFFPTVIAGPIMKARDSICQFHRNIDINRADLKAGVQILLMGCLKKYVLADRLGVFVGDVYNSPLAFDFATVWLAVITYSLQLYLDFAGYSDMAIGFARCLGFHLCDNFNMPYIARNISEFWKRWHISLSRWLQEYLYFLLGGSRCGTLRSYLNLLVTMLICGLWHGAAWNFVLWGGTHGVLLVLYRSYKNNIKPHINIPVSVSVIITSFSVMLCWIFFRATDMRNISDIFYRLFVWETFGVHQMFIYSWFAIILIILLSLDSVLFHKWDGFVPILNIGQPKYFFVFCLEVLFFLCFVYTNPNPFVYATF